MAAVLFFFFFCIISPHCANVIKVKWLCQYLLHWDGMPTEHISTKNHRIIEIIQDQMVLRMIQDFFVSLQKKPKKKTR